MSHSFKGLPLWLSLHGRRLRTAAAVFMCCLAAALASCAHTSETASRQGRVSALPERLISIANFDYQGAFAIPSGEFGESRASWSAGTIEVNGKSLFLAGHDHDDAIAEFEVPAMINSKSIDDLPYAKGPIQGFTKVLTNVSGGNKDNLDQIIGLELVEGKLIGNAIEYYDAPADNTQTTFVVENAAAIEKSPVTGFYRIDGRARAAGWLSQVPMEWQKILGCTHITGNSSGGPIIGRHSVGPSAFCINFNNKLRLKKRSIKTAEMLGFSENSPLARDLFNESSENNLWTHMSQARYGFIVPGTSTYMTIGFSGGHQSGVGYKLRRRDGQYCPGYCAVDPTDMYNYYWLWDMRDLVRVRQRRLSAKSLKPYESGVFDVPFQNNAHLNPIGGATFDEQSGLLYISVLRANSSTHNPASLPVIAAYKIR